MEQTTIPIDIENPGYVPTEDEFEELNLEWIAGRIADKGKHIYYHPKEGHDYGPIWTLGDWWTTIYFRDKEHIKQFL